jgi:hypothetical protein
VLRVLATQHASELKQQAAELTKHLRSTGLPLVVARAGSIEETVSRKRNLAPTGHGGFDELRAFANNIYVTRSRAESRSGRRADSVRGAAARRRTARAR